jgi:hypothetical protein
MKKKKIKISKNTWKSIKQITKQYNKTIDKELSLDPQEVASRLLSLVFRTIHYNNILEELWPDD